jgi:hypothetical protein
MMSISSCSSTRRISSLHLLASPAWAIGPSFPRRQRNSRIPRSALQAELSPGTVVRFVSIPALIAMKQLAHRARDRDDIEHLRMILEEQRKR